MLSKSPYNYYTRNLRPQIGDYPHFWALTLTMPEKMFVSVGKCRKQWIRLTTQQKIEFYMQFFRQDIEPSFNWEVSFEVHPNIGHDNIHCHSLVYGEYHAKDILDKWMSYSKIKVDMVMKITNIQSITYSQDKLDGWLDYMYKEDPNHFLPLPKLEGIPVEDLQPSWGGRGGNNNTPCED